jgi:uncharacterized protein YjiS (DUF1127 family)
MHIRRRLYQAIVANNIALLWGSETSWALKEEDRSKLERLSPQDAPLDDVGRSRTSDHERNG